MTRDSRPLPKWAETGTGSVSAANRAAVPQAIARLLAFETPAVRWLKAAGPIARRLNEEAAQDMEGGEK